MRLKSRIKETVTDGIIYVNPYNDTADTFGKPTQAAQGPKQYIVKVQVKVWIFWVTVWAEVCNHSDGDSREYIKNCAQEVQEALTEKV